MTSPSDRPATTASPASPVPEKGEGGARAYLSSLVLLILGFGLDRLHKTLAISPDCVDPGGSHCIDFAFGSIPATLSDWRGGEYIPVTGFFDYVLVWNTGISYGLLSAVPVWALGILSAAALIGLAIWWVKADSALIRAGLALAIGGALSNALDRYLYGAVADFFHFHVGEHSFYIFNLADTAITIGVVMLILDLLGLGRRKRA